MSLRAAAGPASAAPSAHAHHYPSRPGLPPPQDVLMLGYSLIVGGLIALGLALALLHWLLNADGMLWVQVRSLCCGVSARAGPLGHRRLPASRFRGGGAAGRQGRCRRLPVPTPTHARPRRNCLQLHSP